MDLIGMNKSLRRTVENEGYAALFEEARRRRPELARHETVRSVLATLEDTAPERYAERDALTRALVAELQRKPHSLWSTVLQIAYFPMLCRLRCRILGETVTGHEVDQLVATSFLEVLHDLPLGPERDRLCMHVRQNTQRRVFRCLQQEQRLHESFFLRSHRDITWLAEEHYEPEGDETPDQEWRCLWPVTSPTAASPLDSEDRAELVSLLVEMVGHVLSPDELDLVIATLVRGEQLTDRAQSLTRGQPPAEQQRAYQRIKRRHTRARAKLRKALAHLRPSRSGPPAEAPRDPGEKPEARSPFPRGCRAGSAGATRARHSPVCGHFAQGSRRSHVRVVPIIRPFSGTVLWPEEVHPAVRDHKLPVRTDREDSRNEGLRGTHPIRPKAGQIRRPG